MVTRRRARLRCTRRRQRSRIPLVPPFRSSDGRGRAPGRLPDGCGRALDRRAAASASSTARSILRVYHSGQLGSEKDTLELARIGALAVTRVHSSVLNNAIPATRILSLPYVFDSTEHMRRAFDGSFGDEILAACARGDCSGSRSTIRARGTSTMRAGRSKTPSDLHGLKLRVPQSDIFMESVAALGASPTPLALQHGVLRAANSLDRRRGEQLAELFRSRHFEIARHWSESEHAYAPDMLLMSQRAADSLPERAARLSTHDRTPLGAASCASAGTRTCRPRGEPCSMRASS